MQKFTILLALFLFIAPVSAQENTGYQKPPKEILELVDAPLAPSVLMDDEGENVVLLYRDAYKSIAELSESEMRLAGLRINPKTNIGSRTNYYNNIELKKATATNSRTVSGLPENGRFSYFNWSPDQKKIAFLHTTAIGVEVWVLDIENSIATKLTEPKVNANMGDPINWFKDNTSLLVKMLPKNKKELNNPDEAVPEGPTISVSSGEKAQNRTYQDLLKNPYEEGNFY